MKILGIVVKVILSIMLSIYMLSDVSVIYAVVWGGLMYGVLSFSASYLKKSGFSFTVWVGEKGFFMTLLSMALSLLAPLLVLSLFATAINSILPGVGMTIAGGIIAIMCLVFIIKDVEAVIQIFNPSFKIFKSEDKWDEEDGEGEGR